jgi:PAS domain S-box-containing protein
MRSRTGRSLGYLAVVPLGIGALSALDAAGINIPNQPGVLLLAVAYSAYRGGNIIGLASAAIHVFYTALFFSDPHHVFHYSSDNFARVVVIALVAPAMGLMVGMLRREADRLLARQKMSERDLAALNADLERRVAARTAELLEARDVAEAAQAKAQQSEERLRDFAKIGSDWWWEQDENLRFSFFSSAAFNGSRATAESHLGKTRREVGNAVLSDAEWEAHDATLAARQPFRNLVTKRVAADGKTAYTSTGGEPVFDHAGNFRGYRGTARDVTAEVLAELELERRVAARTEEVHALQRELLQQERRTTLDHLTATVSHEMRNPLSAIRNSAYSMTQMIEMADPRVRRQLDRIERSVQRCENFIAQLVEYSHIRQLRRRDVTLDTWLAEVLDELPVPADIAIQRSLACGSASISADSESLRRVVVQLLENAFQAMAGVNAGQPPRQPWCVAIESHRLDDRTEIAIIDNGPGMPSDVLNRIFEPLFSTKAFGAGLGLPLVKQIVDFHGGGITVTSETGHGTRVVVSLPLSATAAIAA